MPERVHRIKHGAIKVAVPDTSQQTDYSCGASSLQAVCKFYGIGPQDEWQYVDALHMDPRVGSHPFQIKRLARRLGLTIKEYSPMTLGQLRRELDRRHPVMLMIQAWGEEERNGRTRWRKTYDGVWEDGHWVIAIGYDEDGVIFEDPSLQAVRGFLDYDELIRRWRDTGPHGRHIIQYGLAVWHPRSRGSAYEARAVRID
jgi:predicted double-glycine peptidase